MPGRFCVHCGSPRQGDTRFCVTCGHPVAVPAPAAVDPIPAAPTVPRPAVGATPPPGAVPVPLPHPATGRPPGRRRRVTLGVGVVLLALVGAGAAGFVALRDGDRSPDDVADPTDRPATVSLASEPGSGWTVLTDDLLPGSQVQQYAYEELSGTQPLTVEGDTAVVVLSGEEEAAVVGLSTDDGTERWRREGEPFGASACWSLPGTGRIGCSLERSVELLDVASGDTVATVTPAATGGVSSMATDGDTVWVASREYDEGDEVHHPARLTAFTAADGEQRWSTRLDDSSDGVGYDADIFDGGVTLGVRERGLAVAYGNLGWLVDPLDGAVVDSVVTNDGEVFPDDYGLATDVDGVTSVVDADGEVVRPVEQPWYDDGPVVVDGAYGDGAALVDLATGEARWSRPDLLDADSYAAFSWSDDHRYVLADDPDGDPSTGGTTLLDPRDGSDVLHSEDPFDPTVPLTADALAVPGPGRVTVWSLPDGDVAWTRDLEEISDVFDSDEGTTVETPVLVGSETGLLAVGARGITSFSGFSSLPGTAPAAPSDGTATDDTDDTDDGTQYVTDCGTPPDFTAVESTSGDGQLVVTVEVTATCPGGQWLDSGSTDVTVTGDGGVVLASGVFDLSGTPYFVPGPDGAGSPAGATSITLPLSFPADTVYATPDEVADAIEQRVVRVDCVQDSDGVSAADEPTDPAGGADPSAGGTAEQPGADGGRETALEALRRIAREDYAEVGSDLVGSWVPQLSSKQQGLNGSDGFYTYEDILAEHQQLRLTYPDVRLLYSSDWNFRSPGLWVTMTGLTYDSWRPALRYCADQGFDHDHCYTKLLLERGGPVDGTSWLLTDDDRVPRNGPPPLGG